MVLGIVNSMLTLVHGLVMILVNRLKMRLERQRLHMMMLRRSLLLILWLPGGKTQTNNKGREHNSILIRIKAISSNIQLLVDF